MLKSALSLNRSLHSATLGSPLPGRAAPSTGTGRRLSSMELPEQRNETKISLGLLPAAACVADRGLRFAASVMARHVVGVATTIVALGLYGWMQAASAATLDYAHAEPLASHALLLDAAIAGERLVVVGERGLILLSDDQGVHWRQALVPTRTTLTAVFFLDALNGWAVGHESLILRTRDGGLTWTPVEHSANSDMPLFAIRFFSARRGLAVGAQGTALATDDGGGHWSARSLVADTDSHFYSIAATRDGTLYLAGEAGGAYRSTDRGTSWQHLRMPQAGSYFGVIALEDNAVMFYGLRGQIALSRNRGKTFEPIDAGTQASLFGARVLSNGNLVLVGAGGSAFVSRAPYRNFTPVKLAVRGSVLGLLPAGPHALILYGEKGVNRVADDTLLPDPSGAGARAGASP